MGYGLPVTGPRKPSPLSELYCFSLVKSFSFVDASTP
jgi:hypothetical protein